MFDDINVLQINIRGLVSKTAQDNKCEKLSQILHTKQIDIVLIQEWSATKERRKCPCSGATLISDSDDLNSMSKQLNFH